FRRVLFRSSRVLLGIFRIGGGLETVLVGPGIEVDDGIHDTATELAKARATADHTLLFQRTWRQAKVGGRLFVREVALRLDSSKLHRCAGGRSTLHRSRSHKVN